jgi:site-specific DNA-methyltransferase (adenine-specific)
MDKIVSARKPFGLSTIDVGHSQRSKGDICIYQRGGVGSWNRHKVLRNIEWVDKFKIFITKAYNAGDVFPHQILNKPIVVGKGTCCNETYLVIGPFKSKHEAENVASYVATKFFRFIVALKKISQDATQKVYSFVPMQDFSKPWTDAELYKKYKLTKDEIAFIESMIKPME